jgi:hypothetical protein
MIFQLLNQERPAVHPFSALDSAQKIEEWVGRPQYPAVALSYGMIQFDALPPVLNATVQVFLYCLQRVDRTEDPHLPARLRNMMVQ